MLKSDLHQLIQFQGYLVHAPQDFSLLFIPYSDLHYTLLGCLVNIDSFSNKKIILKVIQTLCYFCVENKELLTYQH